MSATRSPARSLQARFAALEIDPHLRARHGHRDDRVGGANVGPWTDIYAMAAILRMIATGVEASRLPSADQRTRVLAGEPDPVDLLPPFPEGFPERIARAIRHGMALQRADRPQSIAEWRAAFDFAEPATAINVRTVTAPAIGDARAPIEPEPPTKTITLTKTPTAIIPPTVPGNTGGRGSQHNRAGPRPTRDGDRRARP